MAAALCLLLALATPTAGLVTSETGPAPPFRSLRLEPRERRLSWELSGDVRNIACSKEGRSPVWPEPGGRSCLFPSLSLCHVTKFTVFNDDDPEVNAWILFPESDPNRAAAATDVQCSLHHVDRISCRWGRGRGAPSDVQYRMFWRDAGQGRERDRECQLYDVTDEGGAHLGCTVNAAGVALPVQVAVTVTGSSAREEISCSDVIVDLQGAEVLAPPTVRAECNGSDSALLSWEMRSRFHFRFAYEVEMTQVGRPGDTGNRARESQAWAGPPGRGRGQRNYVTGPIPPQTTESHFRFRIPGSASFRVRARPFDVTAYSAWSEAVRLDCSPGGRSHVTLMVAVLVAVGAGLTALATMLLLCRRRLLRKLFPPIPSMKDPMAERAEPAELVTWEATPEDPEVTQVTEA
ncbi:interleukin-3 receptor subunit alpha-like [Cricetulus griseus]|uniref:Interleukin-3 receptor subunit alpha-like n=1 Tax=Cricetulus griseus TaxID=10029 RepID=A0A9J7HCG4_CRIGR|nr:interleukin-3 receptor subunit alpha-like [Cricetulus griseus]